MKLIWEKYNDALFGEAFRLMGLPDDACGVARRHGGGKFIAHASIGGRYLSHVGATRHIAMKRLNSEICRRSIGLLGVDDVEFSICP